LGLFLGSNGRRIGLHKEGVAGVAGGGFEEDQEERLKKLRQSGVGLVVMEVDGGRVSGEEKLAETGVISVFDTI
jgi:hypothetical protein